jgi:hypothetical protein
MGKNLTSGRRLTLTNTSLSSLPIYTMGMYKLQEEIRQQLDSIRAFFFARGSPTNNQQHSLLSQASLGRLEMKPKGDKK